MEWGTSEVVADSPGIGTDGLTVLYQTKVAEGNRHEDDRGVAWRHAVWSAGRLTVPIPYRSPIMRHCNKLVLYKVLEILLSTAFLLETGISGNCLSVSFSRRTF